MTPMVRSRLQKLLPRLASNADGEVLATVRAIRSALQSDGLDLHDLAAAIGDVEIEHAPRLAQIAAAPSWADLSRQEREGWMAKILADPDLGPFERDKLGDLAARLRAGMIFSPHPHRRRLFDERLARLHAQGVRP